MATETTPSTYSPPSGIYMMGTNIPVSSNLSLTSTDSEEKRVNRLVKRVITISSFMSFLSFITIILQVYIVYSYINIIIYYLI